MKSILFTLLAISTSIAFGQTMPRTSQKATVNQTVGLNDVSIEYSRPSANNRVIFGDVVPFNEVWRLGANESTKFTCSKAVMIGNSVVEPGTYSMFVTPTKNSWEVVFNTDIELWGSDDYDATKDVASYTAAVASASHSETMTISFDFVTQSSANIVIRWDNTSVSIPFWTNTEEAVHQEIDAAIATGKDLARVHYNAADFFMDANNMDAANSHLKKSLEIERAYYNVYLKAQMVAKDDVKAGQKLAEEAATLAMKADKEGWANYIKRNAAEWK